jgi:NAD(P)-dependent dehydrogenase (short-subunit alcohol dehydrogenase family)
MMSGLAGKVAVVTGGAGGLGAASALRLSREGCRVVVVDVDADGARKVAESLPGESIAVKADVASEEDVDRYLSEATEAFGRVDLHHLNAGIPGSAGAFPDLKADEFDRVMAVNVRGLFLGLRGAFRLFRAQGSTGSVVLTASIASLRGSADLIAYQTSKHATLGLLSAPLRRAGTPDEIGSVVAFLLSDEASYMAGEVVSVDGGSSIVSTVRNSGGAGAWDFAALDERMYGPRDV